MPTGRPRSRRVLAHSTAGGRRHARHRSQNRPEPSLHPVQSDGHAMSRARYRSEMKRTDDAARRLLSNCRDRFPWAPCLIEVWLRYRFIMTRSRTLKPETFDASVKCARPAPPRSAPLLSPPRLTVAVTAEKPWEGIPKRVSRRSSALLNSEDHTRRNPSQGFPPSCEDQRRRNPGLPAGRYRYRRL